MEKWIRWEPIAGLSKKYNIEAILDTIDNFTIILSDCSDKRQKVQIVFEDSVDMYRSTDESYRLKMMSNLTSIHGREFYGEWTFFKVENSSYLQWISDQSFGVTNSLPFIHYCFIGANSILDVIDSCEPQITLAQSNGQLSTCGEFAK